MFAVGFFLEVARVGSAIDFAADGAGESLDDAELFVLADEARASSIAFAIQRLRSQLDLERRLFYRQEQLATGGFDRGGGLLVAAQHIDGGLLLVVIDGELDVEFAAAPIGNDTLMRAGSVAVVFVAVIVLGWRARCGGCGRGLRSGLISATAAKGEREREQCGVF